mgnify:FL=1
MCRQLGVSRSAYYNYEQYRRNQSDDLYHQQLLDAVRNIAKSCDYTYGSRRMKRALNALGYRVSRWKARRLMREAFVTVRHRKKYKVTTDSNHLLPVFENQLNRQFTVARPDQVYVCDITYIWTQEGWLYLAVVIDLFSRKVVGWSMSSRMKAALVCDALRMAIWLRQPPPGLIVHSDRGSQYAGKAYRNLLKAYGFVGSMSRLGNCWDNAVAESIEGSLKRERCQYTWITKVQTNMKQKQQNR